MDRQAVVGMLVADILFMAKSNADTEILMENCKALEAIIFANFQTIYFITLYKFIVSTKNKNPITGETIADTMINIKLSHARLVSFIGDTTDVIVDYRKKQKTIFAKYLHSADPYFHNMDILNSVSTDLEASCMEYAKFNSRGHISDNTDICESAEFKASYSPICAEVLSYINVNSLTCKNYGRSIIDGIIQNKIDPKKIAFQPINQLCPESMRREKERIEVRMNQKIELKVSGLFKCPYCKESKSSYKEVQKRALDEPASYVCICLNPDCGRPFTGH
jgi:DNA-directed RNA polymerase subunit M/transcription elongation factor TFIIS